MLWDRKGSKFCLPVVNLPNMVVKVQMFDCVGFHIRKLGQSPKL